VTKLVKVKHIQAAGQSTIKEIIQGSILSFTNDGQTLLFIDNRVNDPCYHLSLLGRDESFPQKPDRALGGVTQNNQMN
jgi:hypothetical protein